MAVNTLVNCIRLMILCYYCEDSICRVRHGDLNELNKFLQVEFELKLVRAC